MDKDKKLDREPPELNLLPFMNLMTLLIPFLLVSIQFMNLAVVDVSQPAIAPARATSPPPEPAEDLELKIAITQTEYVVAGNTDRLDPAVTLQAGEVEALARLLREVRDAVPAACDGVAGPVPEACNVIVAPEGDVPYQAMITAMDAAREDDAGLLFPYAVVAAGVF